MTSVTNEVTQRFGAQYFCQQNVQCSTVHRIKI